MPATIAWLQKVVLILLYVAGKQGSEPGGNTDCYCSQKTSRRASESSNYDHTGMEDMENVSGFRLSSAGLSSCSLRLWIRYCYLGLTEIPRVSVGNFSMMLSLLVSGASHLVSPEEQSFAAETGTSQYSET